MEKINTDFVYPWVKKAFILAVIGMFFLLALTIFFQSDLRGVESNVIYSIQLALENNGSLYNSPEKPPFNITQYAPLYYILNDGLISLLSIETDNFFLIRGITRIVSVLLMLLSLFILIDTLQNVIGINRNSSLIISMTYSILSFPWFNISRPDVLILFFFILSIRSILLFQKSKKSNTAFLLGVFMALGVLSKQTMGGYIISFGLYMIIAKQWRLACFSAISFVSTLVLMCGLIHILGYDLTYLYQNIVKGIDNGTSFFAAWKAYKNYFAYFGLFSLVFVLLSIISLKNWKHVKTNHNLLFLITISYTVAVFSFFSALKVGSAINYFNELLLCLLIFMMSILESYNILKKKLFLIGFMLFGISIAINHTFHYAAPLLLNLKSMNSNVKNESDIPEIITFLESNLGDSYFYSDDRTIAQSFPQRCVLFPTDIHNITYNRKVFDYSFFEEWARENLIFIIVSRDRKKLYDIDIKKYYSLKIKYQNYNLYQLTSYNKE
ncbi:glycosyltransferase family 39 protein [Lewinella sp. LCG006]|uniref:glycosyltransferase family 39 protein n=1 Tax=Lewinella sp. LCG006 TaxID=3231911 RepID=UPI0034606A12